MASRPPQPQNGHPSRRENHSISSNTSASGRSERGSRNPSNPPVESAVTRLLVSIKQLLEALTLWSQMKMDETQVSDVYVRLGNDFNAAVTAFAGFNIDMAELMSVPNDLRNVLEQCLAEDATSDNLEIYLPTVREIITNLLQGLRGKQSIYRRIMSDQRHRSGEQGHERTESRSSRSERTSRRGDGTAHRSQLSRTIDASETPEAAGSVSKRVVQTSGRRRDQNFDSNGDDQFVGGFAPTMVDQTTGQNGTSSYGEPQHPRQPSVPRSVDPPPPPPFEPPPPPPELVAPTPPTIDTPPIEEAPPIQQSSVPASVKRWSLVDKPSAPAPPVLIEPSSPDQSQMNGASSTEMSPNEPPPAVANSLAALKKNDVLERRASKRFSTYNISKMTGASTTRERSLRGNNHLNRRSFAATSGNLTQNELAVLTEVDDEETEPPQVQRDASLASFRRSGSRAVTPEVSSRAPLVPPLPVTPSRTPEPVTLAADSQRIGADSLSADPSRITVFLQLGREVKKVVVEPGLSFSSLRVLFVDKFSYNPGLENFPAIYIRDPSSGVQYELEETDEVKEKCLLSLNIEPLDQIKQHIDTQISTLSNDIKELKSAVASNHRFSSTPSEIMAQHPLAQSTPAPPRPSDRQFQHVARRLSHYVGDNSSFSFSSFQSGLPPQITGQSLQQQMTGASVMSEYSSRVVNDLKTQFDEVQNLRRDIGIMRQLYTEFMKQTKESLGTLRTQTQSVKQLANSNVGGARAYIDSGKKKLDIRSQNALTEVEKLQDTVEGVKDDVIKRHITPKAQYFKNIKKDIDSTAAELQSLKEHIDTIKPMWKKTWEEELQNIVEEQQFLTHQEEFLSDLLEDHKAVLEIYGHVEKVVSLRGPGGSGGPIRLRNRNFRPPPPDEGSNGLSNVMLEIRGAQVDPEKRLKAIEANQRNREKELAARSDDLHAELSEFVDKKKLKMTGGAEEIERVRQLRNDMTLKAMFTGGSIASTNSSSPPSFASDSSASPLI